MELKLIDFYFKYSWGNDSFDIVISNKFQDKCYNFKKIKITFNNNKN